MATGVKGIVHNEDSPCLLPALPQGPYECEECGDTLRMDEGDAVCDGCDEQPKRARR